MLDCHCAPGRCRDTTQVKSSFMPSTCLPGTLTPNHSPPRAILVHHNLKWLHQIYATHVENLQAPRLRRSRKHKDDAQQRIL